MNNLDKQYQDLLKTILEYGVEKKDRTGTGTKSIFGYTIRHNMKHGFPLLTTKKMPFKTIVTELLWFLRGDTNIKFLIDNDCHIWDGDAYKRYETSVKRSIAKATEEGILRDDDSEGFNYLSKESFIERIKTDDEFAKQWGDLGPIYGKQWRSWSGHDSVPNGWHHGAITQYQQIPVNDQISNLINDLKANPDSRRLMVNAWNVGELDQMVLPPCHYGFQVYTRELSIEERLDLAAKTYSTFEPFVFHEVSHKEIDELYPVPSRAISLMWSQRSVDTFLGLPFNIASYGLLLEIIAKEVNMIPDELIGNLGDTHLYLNHIEQAKEQIGRELTLEERLELSKENKDLLVKLGAFSSEYEIMRLCDEHFIPKTTREPFELPTLKHMTHLDSFKSWLFDEEHGIVLRPKDFALDNYQSHPTIKAPLSN